MDVDLDVCSSELDFWLSQLLSAALQGMNDCEQSVKLYICKERTMFTFVSYRSLLLWIALPESDGTIFGTRCVDFASGTVSNASNRTMMSFVAF